MCSRSGAGAGITSAIINRYNNMTANELLQDSKKKVKAISVLKQNNKKYEDILSGKAYYSEQIKEQARTLKERNDNAINILQAEYDVIAKVYENKKKQERKKPIYIGNK